MVARTRLGATLYVHCLSRFLTDMQGLARAYVHTSSHKCQYYCTSCPLCVTKSWRGDRKMAIWHAFETLSEPTDSLLAGVLSRARISTAMYSIQPVCPVVFNKDVAGPGSSNTVHTEHTVRATGLQTADRQQFECIIPRAVNRSLAILRMGKKLPETFGAEWKISKLLLLHLVRSSTLSILQTLHTALPDEWYSHRSHD